MKGRKGKLHYKSKYGLENEKKPVLIFDGIGYGENETVLQKRLNQYFPDMDIIVIDASPTILRAV